MMDDEESAAGPPRRDRRALLGLAGGLAAAVAGCAALRSTPAENDQDEAADPTTDDDSGAITTPTEMASPAATDTGTPTPDPDAEPLEVAHWWRAGDIATALAELLDGFRETSNFRVTQLTRPQLPAGAQSDRFRARLRREPPSTFQTWAGAALRPFVEDDLLLDIRDVWNRTGMAGAVPRGVAALARPAGAVVVMPLAVRHVNCLFYNRQVLADAGVDPTALGTPGDLGAALAAVDRETDATGLAHQANAPWSTIQLWETVLLGQENPDTVLETVTGRNVSRSAVRGALQRVSAYRNHFPDDAGSISFVEATQRVATGQAAFIHQGDWAAKIFADAGGVAYGDDWGYVPFPGTAGTAALVVDGFAAPTNNPSPEATTAFEAYCGRPAVQGRFAATAGVVPPRLDAPGDRFGDFRTTLVEDYRAAGAYLPTVTHGLAVPPKRRQAVISAFAGFLADWDVDATTTALVDALSG